MTTSRSLKPSRGALAAVLVLGLTALLSAACKDANDPSNLQGQYGQPQGQYGQPQGQYGQPQGQYGQPQGQYGQPQGQYGQPQGQYGQPASQPTAPAAAPNPFAPPCQSDAVCGTYKCNLQTQRCAIPCTGPADCMQGTSCMVGVCVPGFPGAAPAQAR